MQSISGQTPLHLAIGTEDGAVVAKLAITHLLLSIPACDPHIADIQGVTPLQIAHKISFEIFIALLEKGLAEGYPKTEQMLHQAMTLMDNKLLHLVMDSNTRSRIIQGTLRNLKSFPVNFITESEASTELGAAVRAGDAEAVKVLLSSHYCDPNVRMGPEGDTPLTTACKMGLLEIAHTLLEYSKDLDFNVQNSEGNTALHCALSRQFSGIEIKLAMCTKLNLANKLDETPLHIACATLNVPAVRELVKNAHCYVNVRTVTGQTPLHLAVAAKGGKPESKVKIVQMLLSFCDCDLNVQNFEGDTPLIITCKLVNHHAQTYLQIIRAFLSTNCDISIRNNGGNTALHFAALRTCHEAVKVLVYSERYLPNVVNKHGEAPLHLACYKLQTEIVKILVKAGKCNVNLRTVSGQTPLHLAVRADDTEPESKVGIIQLLLAVPDCDPNVRNSEGDTPLMVACKRVNWQVWNWLIIGALLSSDKCDPNIQNNDGNTALHLPVVHSSPWAIKLLVGCEQYKPDILNKLGQTPLHVACSQWNVRTFPVLLKEGKCNVNAQTNTGQTPLHLLLTAKLPTEKELKGITKGELENICHLLLSVPDCDPFIVDTQGAMPLQIAYQTDIKVFISVLEAVCTKGYSKTNEVMDQALALADNLLIHLTHYRAVTVMKHALSSQYSSAVINKVEASSGDASLHITIKAEYVEAVEVLLGSQYCDPNVRTAASGDTPLIVACRLAGRQCTAGCCQIICLLLSNDKCDVNSQNDNGTTALHIAVAENCQEIVTALVGHEKCNSDITNNLSIAPLHCACSQLSVPIVEAILQGKKCNVNLQTSTGQTPLHLAVQPRKVEPSSKVKLIKLLLSHPDSTDAQNTHHQQCNPNIKNSRGETPLHIAVNASTHDGLLIAATLLHNIRCDPNVQNAFGETPLHISCSQLSIDKVSMLLKDGRCDVNAQTNIGKTPLHLVLMTSKPKSDPNLKKNVVFLLLEVPHCDILIADARGVTPLQIAYRTDVRFFTLDMLETKCRQNYSKSKEMIEQAMELTNNNLLHLATQYRAITVMKCVLRWKASPTIVNKFEAVSGDTPLIAALKAKFVEGVEVLLHSQYCDSNVRSASNGDTPLITACKTAVVKNGSFQIMCLLLSNDKCDLNSQNDEGNTALHIAAAGSCQEAVIALVGNERCNPDIVNNQGEAPLHVACGKLNVPSAAAILHGNKCKINQQTSSGQTPLHLVVGAQKGKPGCKMELIQLLLSHGDFRISDTSTPDVTLHCQAECDPNIRNSLGETPLHIAVANASFDNKIFKALLNNTRSDPNVQNNSGETPLHIACKLRKHDCVIALTESKQCELNFPDKNGHTPLHKAIYNIHQGDISIIEHLVLDRRCDVTAYDLQGNTALHIACTKAAWKQDDNILHVIRLLLSTGKVDPQCVNNAGETPIQLAVTNEQIVQELSSFSTAQLNHPVQTFVKIFVVGNAETGKSTLVESVCTDASKSRKYVPSQFKMAKGVKPHTAGIVPVPVNNRHFGNAVIYDFAGQHEYYSSHAAVLENLVLSSPPVFLLTVDLSEPFDHICETVAYWWSFIASYTTRSRSSPHVIIVGSHKDVVKSRGEKVQEILHRLLVAIEEIPTNFILVGCVTLDCRMVASENLTKLLSMLKHTCGTVRKGVKIDLRCHILTSFLSDVFSGHVACTLADVIASIKAEENTLLPQSTADLVNLLAALSDKDRILLLKNSEHPEDSWIILQRQKVFGDINGSIFAPEYFDEYVPDFSRSTGIVPVSKLKKHFPQYPPEVVTGFLSHLQFCFKIGDAQTLELITTEESDFASDEDFYFFPALVSHGYPPEENVWDTSTTNRQLRRRYGWLCECTRRYQYLMSRFLHVLILRLAFSHALAMEPERAHNVPVVHRRCSIWKRGIAWRNNDGIETVVEVGLLNQWVVVMMQCPVGMEAECTQLRRSVIKAVLDAEEEFCPEVSMTEYLMHPGITEYPFQRTKQLALYRMKEVCKVMIEGKAYVVDKGGLHHSSIAELLPCEPYVGLGKRLITQLYIPECAQEVMTDCVFSEFAQAMMRSNPDMSQQKLKLLASELLPSTEPFFPPDSTSECVLKCTQLLQQVTPVTFQNLSEMLNNFSILCGRNPWDLSGLSPATELLEGRFSASELRQSLEQTDDSLLGIESLLEVRTEVVPAVSHSANLGLALGLSQASKLHVIQHNWPNDIAFQLTEIMAEWLQGMGKSSWRSLAMALLDPAVDCPLLARDVIEHHTRDDHCAEPSDDGKLTYHDADGAPLGESFPGDILPAVVQGGHFSWFHLGLVLGLHYGTLKDIQNERTSYTECVAVVITKWLNQVDSVGRRGQPSWRVLARALAHPLVGQHKLADDIAREHPAQDVTSISVTAPLPEVAILTSAESSQSLHPIPPSPSTAHPPTSPPTSSSPSH